VDGDNLDHSFSMSKTNNVYKNDYACMIIKCTNSSAVLNFFYPS
jgi:hypothetical protein